MEATELPVGRMSARKAIEYRYTELRRDGERSVSGTVVRFDDEADIEGVFRERIVRDALRPDDTILNLQHDRAKPLARLGANLRFNETSESLEMRAEIVRTPSGDEALALMEAGIIRGLSVEMRVERDEWRSGDNDMPLRIVQAAVMRGISLVDRPAYPQSSIDRWERESGLVAAPEAIVDLKRFRLYL